ncbi:LytR C-terminal domain-containing protein [Arthrobacter sp. VKM Ac-2550]|uniref:LytR C-terminal domain-containing protein n=1 Tax=Crystallibacter permensis TaxID=1938888 RepID=UPI002226647D|nr:LytR C-terminal domain-containing protein [Arthrobacter sp. VKM Ac-2550]MCW2134757.1 LytR cell envelope-related transcriptional attenuator [Arthrobacter sp. VKM Ac-2550]
MTKYSRDEFDQVPETSDRHGVHRAHMAASKSSGLGLIILATVLALAVGVLSFFVLPLLGAGGASTELQATAAPSAKSASPSASEEAAEPTEDVSEPAVDAAGTATEAAEEPLDEPTTKPAAEPTEEPVDEAAEAAAAVNKADPVLIFNSVGVSGLGGAVSQTVTSDGWAVGVVDNWQGTPMANSVIFYNPGQGANAQALGELLGINDLRETGPGAVSEYVTVVLGPGFQQNG